MNTRWNLHLKSALMMLVVGLVAGCATVEQRPAALEDARIAVDAARLSPQVISLAPVELSDADAAYQRAQALYRSEGDTVEVRHLAYLARQRASIARETAVLRSADLAISNANSERDRVRLLARTREAENANRAAAVAQARAEASRRDALAAEQQARQSQNEALLSRQQARDAEIQTAALAAELRDIKANPTDRGMVITLGDVLFDSGSAKMRSGGLRVIDRLAVFLREHPDRSLAIEGFTDNVGSAVVNEELSRRRAEAVRAALMDAGIDGSRIVARGYGATYPVATNDTPEGRQRNRRVEIVVSDEHGTILPRVAGYAVPAQ